MATGGTAGYGGTETGQPLAAGQYFGGIKTQVTSQTYGNGQNPFVTLLAGSSSVGVTPTMAWRTSTSADVTAGGAPIISNVVKLLNINQGDAYAVEMNYDNTLLTNESATQAVGDIYLADRQGNGTFRNATLDNTGGSTSIGGLSSSQNYAGSFATFLTSLGGQYATDASNPSLLTQAQVNALVGSWGVDITNHDAWAVVNYDAEFGVVPEPGTFALLGAAVGVVGLAYRARRKKAIVPVPVHQTV
jgi:hypothetical protein